MEHTATFLLVGLLAIAAFTDLTMHRIPNSVVCSVALIGLFYRATSNGRIESIVLPIATAVALGAVLVIPWRSHILGGGDVKLMSATALWFRPTETLVFLVATALAGGIVSLTAYGAAFARRPVASEECAQPADVSGRVTLHQTIPYGVAIAAGGMFAALAGR